MIVNSKNEKMNKFPAIPVVKKDGSEPFSIGNEVLGFSVLDFWQWSSSDLVNNALRGILAEFIVASAINCVDKSRTEWDAYDLKMRNGVRVEVKSAAYLQSWAQTELSKINFTIKPTKRLNEKTNTYSETSVRQSDVCVFCVLSYQDQATINPLDLNQWDFYVVATQTLNEKLGNQGNISLSSLKKLNPLAVGFKGINSAIARVLSV